jgi:hypothetical protein
LRTLAQQKDVQGKPTALPLRADEAWESARRNRNYGWGEIPDKPVGLSVAELLARLDSYLNNTPLPTDFPAFLNADVLTWES